MLNEDLWIEEHETICADYDDGVIDFEEAFHRLIALGIDRHEAADELYYVNKTRYFEYHKEKENDFYNNHQ